MERIVSSIERLEKWHGNLLNWYDTKTLRAMAPRYVSTVDSGNFACCAVAAREGLLEYKGEDSGSLRLPGGFTKSLPKPTYPLCIIRGASFFTSGTICRRES